MKLTIVSLLLIFSASGEENNLDVNELKITTDVADFLKIRQLIIISENFLSINKRNVQTFYSLNIPVAFVSEMGLFWYMNTNPTTYFKVMVVYKSSSKFQLFLQFLAVFYKKYTTFLVTKFTWLMFLDKSDNDIPFTPPYDCQFITVSPINQSRYLLSEIYTLKTKRVIADYGTWDLYKGLNVSATLIYLRRTNMNQTIFVALKHNNKCEEIEHRQYTFCWYTESLKDIVKHLNFRYSELFTLETNLMLTDYFHVDSTVAAQVITRSNHVKSFLKSAMWQKLCFIIKYPQEELTSEYYIRPFRINVWISIIFMIIIGGITFVIIEYTETCFFKNRKHFQCSSIIYTAHECLCNQSTDERKNISFRTAWTTFRFLAFFIVPAFSGDLTAYLSIRILKIPFQTVEDFAENGKYKLFFTSDDFIRFYFKTNNDPIFQRIFSNLTYNGLRGLGTLCNEENSAVVYHNFELYKKVVPCRIFKIPTPFLIIFETIAFTWAHQQPPHPFSWILNNNFLKMRQAGVFQKQAAGNQIQETTSDGLFSIEIEQMFQVFVFVPIGILVALMILLFELVVKRFTIRKGMNTTP